VTPAHPTSPTPARAVAPPSALGPAAAPSSDPPIGERVLRALRASPPWLAGLFTAHVLFFGLVPALCESARLSTEEARLSRELERVRARQLELGLLRRAQQDPIYVERERRARRILAPRAPLSAPPRDAGAKGG
jgi:hypothetical protein